MKTEKTDRHQGSNPRMRRGRRRVRRWLVVAPIVFVAALTILWLAPVIVAHTALRQQILSSLLSDFEGSVTIESASLGWLSPVVANDIQAYDGDGHPLVEVKSLRSEKSLLALLSDQARLGQFQIEHPAVHLVLRQDGSNWQDALAPLLAKPSQPVTVEQLDVEIIGGQIEILDATGDDYRVDQLNLTLEIADGVQSLTLDTDFAQLQVQGSLKTADVAEAGSWAELSDHLDGKGTRIDGQVDLAQLASMLSGTLELRPSTQLQSGTAKLWLAGPSDDQAGWAAGLEVTGLAAVDGGVRVQQQQPIRFAATIHPASNGPTTYQIDCQSAFLQAAIRGAGPEGSVLVQEADLSKFASEVGPFVGLSSDQLSGRLQGDIQWQRAEGARVSAEGKFRLSDFRFVDGSDNVWTEDQMRFEAQGQWDGENSRVSLRSASLTSSIVAFDARELVMQMPPGEPSLSGTFRYRADLQRLSRLLWEGGRVPDQQLAGVVTGEAQISHASGVTQVDWSGDGSDLVYASRPAAPSGAVIINAVHRPGLSEQWREAVVQFSGCQRYDHRHDTLEIDRFLIETQTLRLSTSGHIRQLSSQCTADLSGEVHGDLARLSDRLRPILGPNIELIGQDKGLFAIRGPLASNRATASSATTGQQDTSGRRVSMTSAGTGQVTAIDVISPELKGDASFGWQSANIHGLIVGRGNLAATLEQGVIQFAPLQVPVSDGRFLGRPWIDLRAQPVSLRIAKGPLVENVRISPEMCSA